MAGRAVSNASWDAANESSVARSPAMASASLAVAVGAASGARHGSTTAAAPRAQGGSNSCWGAIASQAREHVEQQRRAQCDLLPACLEFLHCPGEIAAEPGVAHGQPSSHPVAVGQEEARFHGSRVLCVPDVGHDIWSRVRTELAPAGEQRREHSIEPGRCPPRYRGSRSLPVARRHPLRAFLRVAVAVRRSLRRARTRVCHSASGCNDGGPPPDLRAQQRWWGTHGVPECSFSTRARSKPGLLRVLILLALGRVQPTA